MCGSGSGLSAPRAALGCASFTRLRHGACAFEVCCVLVKLIVCSSGFNHVCFGGLCVLEICGVCLGLPSVLDVCSVVSGPGLPSPGTALRSVLRRFRVQRVGETVGVFRLQPPREGLCVCVCVCVCVHVRDCEGRKQKKKFVVLGHQSPLASPDDYESVSISQSVPVVSRVCVTRTRHDVLRHVLQVDDLLRDGSPVMEGQLKEKKGRWKFLKRWKTRYFTLSGAAITYNKKDSVRTIEVKGRLEQGRSRTGPPRWEAHLQQFHTQKAERLPETQTEREGHRNVRRSGESDVGRRGPIGFTPVK